MAFGAAAADIASVDTGVRCELRGEPRVLATRVSPTAGVKATSMAYRVWLDYRTSAKGETTVAVAPESLEIVADHVPPPREVLARPARGMELATEDGNRLLAWTQGDVFPITNNGGPASTGLASSDPVDLGYQGRAVGEPAVAITSAGSGVVAFIESNGTGFQLVAMRVSCSAP
ncbi:MAG TPA: hypothetical protein VF765_37625 [Polyangiaceae bacterium]